ncbi:MAG: hypothetical protein ACLFWD_05310, partial [Anaerolineales bacterium]
MTENIQKDRMAAATPSSDEKLSLLSQEPSAPWKNVLTRLRRNKLAIAGFIVIGIVVMVALLAPVLAQHHPNEDGVFKAFPGDSKQAPSLTHPM